MIDGLRAVFGGIGFVIVTPRVWAYASVPVLLLFLLGCGLTGLGVWGADWLTGTLVGEPEGFWGHVGSWSLTILFALTFTLAALLLAILLAQPLSGFALEAIVLAQERALLGRNLPHSTFLTALWISTRATLIMVTLGVIVNVALFLVDFFFPPAAAVTAPIQFIAGGWLLAWNFLDYPLSLRGLGVLARLRWTVRHFEAFTVFGLVWALLIFMPGLFFFVLPMGVAGAARLVIAAEHAEALEPESDDEELVFQDER
jgi:CysZ protein